MLLVKIFLFIFAFIFATATLVEERIAFSLLFGIIFTELLIVILYIYKII